MWTNLVLYRDHWNSDFWWLHFENYPHVTTAPLVIFSWNSFHQLAIDSCIFAILYWIDPFEGATFGLINVLFSFHRMISDRKNGLLKLYSSPRPADTEPYTMHSLTDMGVIQESSDNLHQPKTHYILKEWLCGLLCHFWCEMYPLPYKKTRFISRFLKTPYGTGFNEGALNRFFTRG